MNVGQLRSIISDLKVAVVWCHVFCAVSRYRDSELKYESKLNLENYDEIGLAYRLEGN